MRPLAPWWSLQGSRAINNAINHITCLVLGIIILRVRYGYLTMFHALERGIEALKMFGEKSRDLETKKIFLG
jgi:uncharacterized membrane protein YcfT